jgi:predicted membrane-bound spermidine synthase
LGAATGALLSGFVLVGAVGLPGTVRVAALLNLLVAAGAVLAWRAGPRAATAPVGATPRPGPVPRARATEARAAASRARGDAPAALMPLLLGVSFGTAVASFIYEIAWIRMLSLVLGTTTRSFEVMLSAFILGLALGALWMRSRADRYRAPLEVLGLLQCAMGSLALATLPIYLYSFYWISGAIQSLPETDGGYLTFMLVRYGICLAVMLPATFCAGTTLPLITRTLMAAGAGERAIGFVYGVNTLGSILGAILAGLVLMPLIGLKGLLISGAIVDVALGIALLTFQGRRSARAQRLGQIAAALTAVLVVAVAYLVRLDRHLLTSGVYRMGLLPDTETVDVVSYRDGRTASVSVEHYAFNDSLALCTNGKGDASLRELFLKPEAERPRTVLTADESTQVLIGLLTLAHAPQARSGAVIGHGAGVTAHHLLGSSHLEHLTTVEIEPEVIEASRHFFPFNRRVFEDRRSQFVVDDAKSYFAAGMRTYDLIVSEPSNPWVSGVAGLFSTEFYRRIARHLTPDGVFGQWLSLWELNDDLALNVLAAIHENFRSYEMFMVSEGDMFIIATNRPAGLTPDWSVVAYPGIAADLRNVPHFSPTLLDALRVGGRAALAPLLESGIRSNSDFYPLLDEGAERAQYRGEIATGFLQFHSSRFSYTLLAGGQRVRSIRSIEVPAPDIARLHDLAMAAALRTTLPRDLDPEQFDVRLPVALKRHRWLERVLASAQPPDDWRAWVHEALAVENDWHLGSLGVVDEEFYARVSAYLARTQAPPQALQTFEFMHSLATWDLTGAAQKAEPLVTLAAQGEDWLPPEILLDGAVTARVLTGDVAGARRVYETLLPRVERQPDDLRTRVWRAHLDGASPR